MYLLLWYDSRSIDPIGERLGQVFLASVVAGDTLSHGSSIPAPRFTPTRNRTQSSISSQTPHPLTPPFQTENRNGQGYVSCNLHSQQSIRHAQIPVAHRRLFAAQLLTISASPLESTNFPICRMFLAIRNGCPFDTCVCSSI